MTREAEDKIKTRPDGSIDTAYYMAHGRHLRSLQAHALLRKGEPAPRPKPGFLAQLFGLRPA